MPVNTASLGALLAPAACIPGYPYPARPGPGRVYCTGGGVCSGPAGPTSAGTRPRVLARELMSSLPGTIIIILTRSRIESLMFMYCMYCMYAWYVPLHTRRTYSTYSTVHKHQAFDPAPGIPGIPGQVMYGLMLIINYIYYNAVPAWPNFVYLYTCVYRVEILIR